MWLGERGFRRAASIFTSEAPPLVFLYQVCSCSFYVDDVNMQIVSGWGLGLYHTYLDKCWV